MKKFLTFLAVLMLALAMAACGAQSGGQTDGEGGAEPEGGAEDGQNPVMNFVGDYVCERADVFVECNGDEGAKITVTWGGSAYDTAVWEMTGTFDTDTLQFEYHDCVKKELHYAENGDLDKEEEVYTGGHGFMFFKEGDPLTLTWQDDQEKVAEGMVFEYVGAGEHGDVGLANPWSVADSGEAAAEGAGIDSFDLAEMTISLGDVKVYQYRYTEGLVEADVEFPAVEMIIRKGKAGEDADSHDVSGDYNEYAYSWTQNIKGLEVNCFGDREGAATKTIWTANGYDYSIMAYGLGGDDDYGLSADDLNSIINGLQ